MPPNCVVFVSTNPSLDDIKFIDDEIDRISEDDGEWDSPTRVPPSPLTLGIPNGGPNWPPTLTSERPRRSPSMLSVPNSVQNTVNSTRQRKHRPTMADITLEGSKRFLNYFLS